MTTERWFPIQAQHGARMWGRQWVLGPTRIPWARAEVAYSCYARLYPGQTMERLADRGGFSWMEFLAFDRGGRAMVSAMPTRRHHELQAIVDAFLEAAAGR